MKLASVLRRTSSSSTPRWRCLPPRRSRISEAAGRGVVGAIACHPSRRCEAWVSWRAMPTETQTAQLWICTSCGFIYDPEEGDPDGGIPPGTPFEQIPDDWFCPVCGARKADFEPYEE